MRYKLNFGRVFDRPAKPKFFVVAPHNSFAARTPTPAARAFMEANSVSPAVYAAGREDGGAYFTLANMKRFDLSVFDVGSMPMPIWGETA